MLEQIGISTLEDLNRQRQQLERVGDSVPFIQKISNCVHVVKHGRFLDC